MEIYTILMYWKSQNIVKSCRFNVIPFKTIAGFSPLESDEMILIYLKRQRTKNSQNNI